METNKLHLIFLSLLLLLSMAVKAEYVTVALTDDIMTSDKQETFNTALGIDLSEKSDVNLVFTLAEGADANKLTDQVLGFMGQYAKSNWTSVTGFDMSALTSTKTLPAHMFDGDDKLKTIKLPTLTSLSDNLFTGCGDLTSLTIGDWSNTENNAGLDMAVIPSGCFQNCGNLKNLKFNNVKSVKGWAFEGCTSMTVFPINTIQTDAKVEVGENAFHNTNLTGDVNLPEGITKIYRSSFGGCKEMTTIRFPRTIESVDPEFDLNDTNLQHIIIDGGNTETAISNDKYLTYKGILYSINGGNLSVVRCPIANPEPITIPAAIPTNNGNMNVTEIAVKAFHDCAMTSITLSEGLLKIGNSAFINCKSLTSLTIPKSVTSIEDNFVNECTTLATLTVAEGNSNYYTVDNITYTKGTKVGEVQYYNIFRIPEAAAFAGNSIDLSNINDHEHVTSVGSNAFHGVKNAKTIKLPDEITSLADECFKGCGLETFYVPKSLTEEGFGNAPFSECNSLTTFAPPSKDTPLDHFYVDENGILYNKDHNKLFKVPNNYKPHFYEGDETFDVYHFVKEVQTCAFEGVKNIKTVNFPQGIKEIPHRCFYNSGSVETVLIPNSVTQIGQDAFMGSKVNKVILLTTTETAPKSQNGNYNSFYGIDNTFKLHLSESTEYGNIKDAWVEATEKFQSSATDEKTKEKEEEDSRNFGWYGLSQNNRLLEDIKHRAIFENSENIAGFNSTDDRTILNDKDKSNTLTAQHYDYITLYRDFSGMEDKTEDGKDQYATLALPVDVTKATFVDAFGANSKVWAFAGRKDKVLNFNTVNLTNLKNNELVINKGEAILIQPEYKENSYLLKMNLGGENTEANAIELDGKKETSWTENNKDNITIKETDGNFNIINGQTVSPVTFKYGFYATYQKKSNMPKGSYYMLKDGSFKYAVNSLWTKGLRGFVKGNDDEMPEGSEPAGAKICLDGFITGIDDIVIDGNDHGTYNIYNVSGQLVRKNATSTDGLTKGIYIIKGKKVIVK